MSVHWETPPSASRSRKRRDGLPPFRYGPTMRESADSIKEWMISVRFTPRRAPLTASSATALVELWEAIVADTAWHNDAACRGMGTDLFFPNVGKSSAKAIEVCAACPVLERCADDGRRLRADAGVWGGRPVSQSRKECPDCGAPKSWGAVTCRDCRHAEQRAGMARCSACGVLLKSRGANGRRSGMCQACYIAAGSPSAAGGTKVAVQGESVPMSAIRRVTR